VRALCISGINLNNQPFSIALWVKRTDAANGRYFASQGTATANQGLQIGSILLRASFFHLHGSSLFLLLQFDV
jgi:hypothetical protein